MKIVIFGASGILGQIVTAKALQRGHMVTAIVRKSEQIDLRDPHLVVAEGDIYNPASFENALQDQEAVLSCLGRRGHNAPFVCRDGAKAFVPLMEHYSVPRLVAISAYGAAETRNDSLFTRALRVGVPKHMQDKDEMEALIKASRLDWTLIRPAAYLDRWPKKDYALFDKLKGLYPVITRNAIAECMLDQLKTSENVFKTPAARAKA